MARLVKAFEIESREVHPDLRVRWQNFRGFVDTGELRFRQLSVLIGPNNAGKSSLLAPLLILRQTINSRDPHPALITNGQTVDAGTFSSIIHDNDSSRTLTFELGFHIHDVKNVKALRKIGSHPPGRLIVAFRLNKNGSVELERFEVRDVVDRTYLTRSREHGKYDLEWYTTRPSPKARALLASKPNHFLFDDRFITEQLTPEPDEEKKHHRDDFSNRIKLRLSPPDLEYAAVVAITKASVVELLRSTVYVGPLREPARRQYIVSGEAPRDVGSRGQFAPELLFRSRDDSTLLADVSKWIRHFGFGSSIKVSSASNGTFSIVLGQHGTQVNYADTGSGVAQVLPLVVQGLLLKQGRIILSQPELHLNPRAQTVLADLVASFTKKGLNVLVETHSEHFLLRLRTLMAGKALRPAQVALLYVEKKQKVSTVREVPIDELGHIEPNDWPEGFLEDGLASALQLAQQQMKQTHIKSRSRSPNE